MTIIVAVREEGRGEDQQQQKRRINKRGRRVRQHDNIK
jgi:hypothetical protein